MPTSTIKATFPYKVQEVWDTVTTLENYSWRSDLSKIEVISQTEFIEYTKKGYMTTFTVTVFEPCRRWEFDMENNNMRGHWTGVFTYENGKTAITFTENVTAKNFFMKPFVKAYLKKQQSTYITDLERALNC